MPLNDLDLPALRDLAITLTTLEDVGSQLARAGLEPRFNLNPGERMLITVAAIMPEVRLNPGERMLITVAAIMPEVGSKTIYVSEGPQTAEAIQSTPWTKDGLAALSRLANELPPVASNPAIAECLSDEGYAIISRLQVTPSTEAAPGPAGEVALVPPVPVDPPPAAGDSAGGEPPSPAVSSATDMPETIPPAALEPQKAPVSDVTAAEDGGGGQEVAATDAPVATQPEASAPALAAVQPTSSRPAPWTPDEDARLIKLVVEGVQRGAVKSSAIRAAAEILGRPEEGTKFRLNAKLRDALQAALQGAPTPAAAPTDMASHYAGLIGKDGWTVPKDIDLLDFAILGWPAGDIALELQVQIRTVKPRLDALTGLYTDEATGKQLRRFKREDVLAMLRAWVVDQTTGAA